MARHRDIERAHALLGGEGWHIENARNSSSTGTRKDKRNCLYYDRNNKKCKLLSCYCQGAGNCSSYTRTQS